MINNGHLIGAHETFLTKSKTYLWFLYLVKCLLSSISYKKRWNAKNLRFLMKSSISCISVFYSKWRWMSSFYRNLRFLYFSWISWFSGNSSISRKCLIFSWWNEHLLDKKCSKWQSKVDTLLLMKMAHFNKMKPFWAIL